MNLGIIGIDYDLPNWVVLLLLLICLLYIYGIWPYSKWKKMGIDGPPSTWMFGTALPYFKQSIWELDPMYYNQFRHKKLFGQFLMRKPVLCVMDLDMVRDILVKEFPSFENRPGVGKTGDPVQDNSVAILEGDHWRSVRNILSPTFSTGKLKLMVTQINECGQILTENVEQFANDGSEFDARKQAEACTMDMIGRVAFGLKVNTQQEEDSEFIKMARLALSFSQPSAKIWIVLLLPFMNRVFNSLGMPLFPKDARDFFSSVIQHALSKRKEDDIKQRDALQLMVESLNPNATSDRWTKGELSTDDVLAQCLVFFIAGYETVASAMSFTMYHLATNPECQRKVQEELDDVVGDSDIITYEQLQHLNYLDQAIQETLRINPGAPRVSRTCTSDVTVGGIDIKAGTSIDILSYGIHMDDNIYPNPKTFDPDRFTKEAKEARHQFAWLPFGAGPRNCIGMRLALMEVKIVIAHLFRKYNVLASESMEMPLKLDMFRMNATNGIKLKLEKRQ